MVDAGQAWLEDRGVASVSGADAATFLDNLVTNDLDGLPPGGVRFAALLSPQGKILFEFYVLATADGYLLDARKARIPDLVKRLGLYKLRAKVVVADASDRWQVAAAWGREPRAPDGALSFRDPRASDLGWRVLVPAGASFEATADAADYRAHRVRQGVPEGDADFPLGDAFPHEADYDLQNGVSFTKGCFVGQEVVARMQHKTVVRKRVVRVQADAPLNSGAAVQVGEAAIGIIGTSTGREALAMVRLDRIAEAIDKGQPITSEGTPLTVDAATLEAYRASATARASGT